MDVRTCTLLDAAYMDSRYMNGRKDPQIRTYTRKVSQSIGAFSLRRFLEHTIPVLVSVQIEMPFHRKTLAKKNR